MRLSIRSQVLRICSEGYEASGPSRPAPCLPMARPLSPICRHRITVTLHQRTMDENVIATMIWTAVSTLVAAIVALVLSRRAARRSRWLRTVIATAFAFTPSLMVTAVALLSSGDPLSLILSMSPDEFLLPFAYQLAVSFAVALPVSLLISGHTPERRDRASAFE